MLTNNLIAFLQLCCDLYMSIIYYVYFYSLALLTFLIWPFSMSAVNDL